MHHAAVADGDVSHGSIRGDRFRSRLCIDLFRLPTQCNLRGVASVNVKYGWDGPGMGTFLLFGVVQVIIGWVLDFLMPSIGGPFQIELATAKGPEMMAWQGHSESTSAARSTCSRG